MDGCCEEKLRLLFEFRKATKSYSTRVGAMAEATAGIIPSAEFARLSKNRDPSPREVSRRAREALQTREGTRLLEHGIRSSKRES